MSCLLGIMSIIRTDATLYTLLSTRQYVEQRPQNTVLPAITMQTTNTNRTYSHDGSTNNVVADVQLDCWGRNYMDALTVAEHIRRVFDGYQGVGGVISFHAIFVANEIDNSELVEPASDILYRRITIDLECHYCQIDFGSGSYNCEYQENFDSEPDCE